MLASASPRRLDLLRQIGLVPDAVDPAEIDEMAGARELPAATAARLARAKADAVASRHGDAFVLAADTVVALGRRALPKAETEAEARACLEALSGRRHRVLGGICLVSPGGRRTERLVATVVRFKRIERAEIEAYLASGEWHGKAGGYAIQGLAAAMIPYVGGSHSNVVGLALAETAGLLAASGFPVPWRKTAS